MSLHQPLSHRLPQPLPRVLGCIGKAQHGPLLLCVGGVHGNEPSGVLALLNVFQVLRARGTALRGRFVGLAGHLSALRGGCRYFNEDLNRMWCPQRIESMLREPGVNSNGWCAESREMAALLDVLAVELGACQGQAYFVDLHSTSAGVAPFGVLTEDPHNCEFARHFPATQIVGFEHELHGTLIDHMDRHGLVTFGFEGGQHQAPSSVTHHEAAIWTALHAAGCIEALPEVRRAKRTLTVALSDRPTHMEIHYHHRVEDGADFRMLPGFSNFDSVAAEQVVARDRDGVVAAPIDGFLLMPLYQPQGNDGFFICRPLS